MDEIVAKETRQKSRQFPQSLKRTPSREEAEAAVGALALRERTLKRVPLRRDEERDAVDERLALAADGRHGGPARLVAGGRRPRRRAGSRRRLRAYAP